MWQKCVQITKSPQFFRGKSVENFSKTRIKMKKYTFYTLLKKKCGGYNHWYIRKVADFHKYTLFKNFLAEIFSKRYFTSKVWKLGKIDLLSLVHNKSSLHTFKTENV